MSGVRSLLETRLSDRNAELLLLPGHPGNLVSEHVQSPCLLRQVSKAWTGGRRLKRSGCQPRIADSNSLPDNSNRPDAPSGLHLDYKTGQMRSKGRFHPGNAGLEDGKGE